MKHIDFYFDYLSPFAYLASLAILPLAERNACTLTFRPVLFAGLLNHWGQKGPAEIPPKALYALRACARHARLRGIPFRSPRYHPFKPLTALRATLAAAPEDRIRVTHSIYGLGWGAGGDIGDAGEIADALTRAGLDGAKLVAQAESEEMKALLRAETASAIDRGVFGIPTMIVGDELFWGLDQLEALELHLQGRDPLVGVDIGDLFPKGIGAHRPEAS